MFTKMALTRGSEVIIWNEALTVCEVALPPVSRKLAQCPPWIVRASTVFMARPAPLTGIVRSDGCGGMIEGRGGT